jgi:serine/threonine-protein kinase/endoribonuclease IRE1
MKGTVVFEGKFEGQKIAIKRILNEYISVAEHEVELLRRSDDHPNVVRYYVRCSRVYSFCA